jgi:hypothetical protein
MQVGGSQSAQENGRCIERRMNSNTVVMYIHVCHVSCSVVVMFACTLVRSHPDSRGVLGVKLEPLQ